MALARSRRETRADYWPGFVDAMATLLLVIIFLLSLFMIAQFFLSQEISGRDTVLNRLNQQIAELTELLALERADSRSLQNQLSALNASLAAAEEENLRLSGALEGGAEDSDAANARIAELNDELEDQRGTANRALSQVELLNQQLAALRPRYGIPGENRRSRPAADHRARTARPGAFTLPIRFLRPLARNSRLPRRH